MAAVNGNNFSFWETFCKDIQRLGVVVVGVGGHQNAAVTYVKVAVAGGIIPASDFSFQR